MKIFFEDNGKCGYNSVYEYVYTINMFNVISLNCSSLSTTSVEFVNSGMNN